MSATIPFARMNGLGNMILVADMRGRAGRVAPEAARALNADTATRFDQLMVIHDARSARTDNYIAVLNSDGSMAETCGNGMRCVTQALAAETGRRSFAFEILSGVIVAEELENGLVSVDMGEPKFGWRDIPLSEEFRDTRMIELEVGPRGAPILHSPSVANMGNPHCIFWVDDPVGAYDLAAFGPMLEHHLLFPERANITLAEKTGDNRFTIRTWERGAGLTQACGSAACAVAVSANRTRRAGRCVTIVPPYGGELLIEWRDDNHVIMTGPAEWEWSGRMDPETGAWTRDAETVA
ncbi:MAG: diaminopimelate epimerase [Rhizobiaceae bacterium]|jgi:diaminopimelate epimerase|nr:diaminopimelate epimerase [Rhizobiaceae bacterium]